jgi:hypothetical protein
VRTSTETPITRKCSKSGTIGGGGGFKARDEGNVPRLPTECPEEED